MDKNKIDVYYGAGFLTASACWLAIFSLHNISNKIYSTGLVIIAAFLFIISYKKYKDAIKELDVDDQS